MCGKTHIDCLHITSWDQDHCSASNLEEILVTYKPKKIEFPGYEPESDNARQCQKLILDYQRNTKAIGNPVSCISITPIYIKGLSSASELGYKDIFYWPHSLADNANDNSTVKVFREGCFNVASLGDVEDVNIASYLRGCGIFKREIDVLILAHHGADCPTNSKTFFEKVRPKLVVCTSNYDNQFDHPRQEVRDTLYELDIPLYTTKTGDIIIQSLEPHDCKFRVYNLMANSTAISSQKDFSIKKHHWLTMNADTIRNLYRGKPAYRRL